MQALPSSVVVMDDTVLVDDLWGQSAAEELNILAAALVQFVRARAGSARVSKVETKLRALIASAMIDGDVSRIDCPEWTISIVSSRMLAVGLDDGIPVFAIASEPSVRVTLR